MAAAVSAMPPFDENSNENSELPDFLNKHPIMRFDSVCHLDQQNSNTKFEIRFLRLKLLWALLFETENVEEITMDLVKFDCKKLDFKYEYFPLMKYWHENKNTRNGPEKLKNWLEALVEFLNLYNTPLFFNSLGDNQPIPIEQDLNHKICEYGFQIQGFDEVDKYVCKRDVQNSLMFLLPDFSIDAVETRTSFWVDFHLAARELELFISKKHPHPELFDGPPSSTPATETFAPPPKPTPPATTKPTPPPASPTTPKPTTAASEDCFMCGNKAAIYCTKCDRSFCEVDRNNYHKHPSRKGHTGDDFKKL